MARKYSAIFQVCPVPECETEFKLPNDQKVHFDKHIHWEKAHGAIAIYDHRGLMKGFLRGEAK